MKDPLNMFPDSFRQKIIQYKHWQDTQASLYGRLLLVWGLAHFYGIRIKGSHIVIDKNGRPFIQGVPVDFNISHSGKVVVCAISDSQHLGIDIEKMNAIEIEDFRPQMTQNELKTVLNSNNPTQAFYDYWTQKEAVIKANGEGLGIPLKSFEVTDAKTVLSEDVWHLTKLHIHQGYSCHIASEAETEHLITHVGSEELLHLDPL